MPEGGCFCGNTRIKYTGEIQGKVCCSHLLLLTAQLMNSEQALCHCADCRKITGSTYSTNIIVPGEGFSVTKGTPKTIGKKGDNTGNTITSHFCGDCGSTLFRDGPTFGDSKVIKVLN
jgi:hypothetical protein